MNVEFSLYGGGGGDDEDAESGENFPQTVANKLLLARKNKNGWMKGYK